jgi:two-component system nitrogen regulation response regulator GlnG
MPTLLVVDDEPNVLYSIRKSFQADGLTVLTAPTGALGLELTRRERPDAVILDVRLGDMSGLEAFDQVRAIDPQLPVIFITAFATTETAIEATKRGAFEYLLKPLDLHQLHEVVGRALELSRLRHVPAVIDDPTQPSPDMAGPGGVTADRIVGRSAAMQEVYKAIGRVAPRDVTVLITGESGTGKELVARALFHHSPRVAAPFLAINCAAIPETLLESELFGHERGAFTGADRRRIGKFEQAHHGTLLLDEIGDMTAATQAKLLRVLQEQRFERLGDNESIQADVRVIAATNKDLAAEVAAGRFRHDLYYRLNVFQIQVPPLRERREDVPLLIDYFLGQFGRTFGRRIHSVTPEVQRCLQAYDWPGNVRQLQSVLKYALIQATGEVITPECLPEALRPNGPAQTTAAPAPSAAGLDVAALTRSLLRAGEPDIYRRICLEVDRTVIGIVLAHTNENQVQASELLGISRTTLRTKLRALSLPLGEQPVEADRASS